MSPSAATRPALLAAAAKPFFLSQSTAASMSPPLSPSALLQSIIPAPVFSRSSLTSAAVTSAICRSSRLGAAGGSRLWFTWQRVVEDALDFFLLRGLLRKARPRDLCAGADIDP